MITFFTHFIAMKYAESYCFSFMDMSHERLFYDFFMTEQGPDIFFKFVWEEKGTREADELKTYNPF